jgi:hypothetical protein
MNTDLDTALVAADHGDPRTALRAARAEWNRRHTPHTADALAWTLHVNGRNQEALRMAHRATRTGYRNAMFLYHRSRIEQSLGHTSAARTHLRAADALRSALTPAAAAATAAALAAANPRSTPDTAKEARR